MCKNEQTPEPGYDKIELRIPEPEPCSWKWSSGAGAGAGAVSFVRRLRSPAFIIQWNARIDAFIFVSSTHGTNYIGYVDWKHQGQLQVITNIVHFWKLCEDAPI